MNHAEPSRATRPRCSGRHPLGSPELVERVLDGSLPFDELLTAALSRLAAECPRCAAAIVAFQAERGEPLVSGRRGPEATRSKRRDARRRASAPDAAARGELAAIRRFQPERRAALVDGASRRFRSRWLAEQLLAEAMELASLDPAESASLALAAERVAARLPGAPLAGPAAALAARGRARQAEAARLAGDPAAAERVWRRLHADLAKRRLPPPVAAELAGLEGLLRRQQGRFTAAAELLELALAHRFGEPVASRAPLMVLLADVYRLGGDPAAGRGVAEEACGLTDGDRFPVAHLCAVHAWIGCELALGRPRTARGRLAAVAPALSSLRPEHSWLVDRSVALEGRIAFHLEEYEEAERKLAEAANRFLAGGEAVDAALAALDLAALYRLQGRGDELLAHAAGVARTFTDRRLPADVADALGELVRRFEADRLSPASLSGLRERVERSSPPASLRLAAASA